MRMDYIPPTRRLRVLNAIIVALISVLVGRLWQIQVLQGRQFLRLSEENRIRDYTITAPRGVIYDRKGRPLVSNRPSFTVAILPLELIVALNGADLALTLRALDLGASELNPAIGRLLEVDLALAVFIKTGLGVSVALTIWTLRRYRTVLEALLLLVAILVAVISYQVAGVMAVG